MRLVVTLEKWHQKQKDGDITNRVICVSILMS